MVLKFILLSNSILSTVYNSSAEHLLKVLFTWHSSSHDSVFFRRIFSAAKSKFLELQMTMEMLHVGVSLNGGTPISHPKMSIVSSKTHGYWVPPF